MLSRSLTWMVFLAVLAGVASAQPAGPRAAGSPTSRPDQAAAAPASQPEFTGVSQVSFYITRSLPPHLQQRHLFAMRTLPRDEQLRRLATLRDSKVAIEDLIRKKRELDSMPPDRQDQYRQRALQLEDLYSKLTPTQLAELRNMNPQKRAKRIQELLAEMKAKSIREGKTDSPK